MLSNHLWVWRCLCSSKHCTVCSSSELAQMASQLISLVQLALRHAWLHACSLHLPILKLWQGLCLAVLHLLLARDLQKVFNSKLWAFAKLKTIIFSCLENIEVVNGKIACTFCWACPCRSCNWGTELYKKIVDLVSTENCRFSEHQKVPCWDK